MNAHHQPSWRKPAGIGIILFVIGALAWAVTTLVEWLGPLPLWVQMLVYIAAGVAWIAPLRPLLMWMETGKWRE